MSSAHDDPAATPESSPAAGPASPSDATAPTAPSATPTGATAAPATTSLWAGPPKTRSAFEEPVQPAVAAQADRTAALDALPVPSADTPAWADATAGQPIPPGGGFGRGGISALGGALHGDFVVKDGNGQ